jgi:hypothetical protein
VLSKADQPPHGPQPAEAGLAIGHQAMTALLECTTEEERGEWCTLTVCFSRL